MLEAEDYVTFTYVRVMGMVQGLDMALDVTAVVRDLNRVHFVLVGDGAERASMQRRIGVENLTNVRLLRAQAKKRIPGLLAALRWRFICLNFRFLMLCRARTRKRWLADCLFSLSVEGSVRSVCLMRRLPVRLVRKSDHSVSV